MFFQRTINRLDHLLSMNGSSYEIEVAGIDDFASNDYLRVQARQVSGGALNILFRQTEGISTGMVKLPG